MVNGDDSRTPPPAATAMIGNLRILLMVLCCCSFSGLVFQINSSLCRNQENVISLLAKENSMNLPSHVNHGVSLSAQDIVQRSFNKSYALLQSCPLNVHLRDCLNETYHAHDTYSYPWWFRTLLRDSLDNRTGVFGMWHDLKSTKPPLQMCCMEKVATKQWRKVFCDFDAPSNVIQCLPDTPRGSYPEQSSEFPKFVFVRDPLERFLSAFLDKCVGMRRVYEDHCEPSIVFQNKDTDITQGLEENKRLLFEAYVDSMPLRWNVHFIPMGLLCNGLYRHIAEYDFVGNMGPNFYSDLYEMGQRFGIFGVLNDVFEVEQHRNKTNSGVETSSATHVEEYYTAPTVRRVLEYLSLDYVSLNLPIPDWAERMLQDEVR